MKEKELWEISEIMNSFDIDEIKNLVYDQIVNSSSIAGIEMDHFRPLYMKYCNIIQNRDMYEDDDIALAEERFYEICNLFLFAIMQRFDISITDDWIENNYKSIPALTLVMYTFFLLDFKQNLYYVLMQYISRHINDLVKEFDELKYKKDATTLSNKKKLSPELCIIVSNIYDISSWILETKLDDEIFLDMIESDYKPGMILKELYEQGEIMGNFTFKIRELYNGDLNLKSQICFDLIEMIKRLNVESEKVSFKDLKDNNGEINISIIEGE